MQWLHLLYQIRDIFTGIVMDLKNKKSKKPLSREKELKNPTEAIIEMVLYFKKHTHMSES